MICGALCSTVPFRNLLLLCDGKQIRAEAQYMSGSWP